MPVPAAAAQPSHHPPPQGEDVALSAADTSIQEVAGKGSRIPQEHSPAHPLSQKDLRDTPHPPPLPTRPLALQSQHPAPSLGQENLWFQGKGAPSAVLEVLPYRPPLNPLLSLSALLLEKLVRCGVVFEKLLGL